VSIIEQVATTTLDITLRDLERVLYFEAFVVVDPGDGSVYYTVGDGDIFRCRHEGDAPEVVAGENMKKDYFGLYDPTSPGHMAYNWRQTVWYKPEKAVSAMVKLGASGYLTKSSSGEQ
jgi:hypothetical protein